MKREFTTGRLTLNLLSLKDIDFIIELTNTPGWLTFIGDKNTKTKETAGDYVLKITKNPEICYWIVTLKDTEKKIGVITFIKRHYLEHYDIGFAFLPLYSGQGYAYEAAKEVLISLHGDPMHEFIYATTLTDNVKSIRLLQNLGLQFEKKFTHEEEELLLYSIHNR